MSVLSRMLQVVEFRDDAADELVHVRDHVGEVFDVFVGVLAIRFRVPVGAIGRWLVGRVGEHHWVVQEEGLRFVLCR